MPATDEPTPHEQTAHEQARAAAQRALVDAGAELAGLRTERDALNDRIRLLGAQVDTLGSVVAAFDRRARVEAEAARPIRRRTKGAPDGLEGPDPDMRQRSRQRNDLRRFALDEPECDHGLTLRTCTICNGRDDLERRAADESARPRRIVAKFAGVCTACSLPIEPGASIMWAPGRKPLHEDCAT
jgi:hypothetical protein